MSADNLKEQLRSLRIERSAPSVAPRAARGGRGLLALAAVVAVLALGSLGAYRWWLGAPLEVKVVRARTTGADKPAVGALLSGAGYLITGEKYIAVGVRVPGRVERYFVDEGDHIELGQLLVKLDDRDYRAQAGRAEAALRVAEANARLAEAQRGRMRQLFSDQVASKEELDQVESRRDVAVASVAQAKNELDQARVSLADTELHSPVRGVVLAKLKTVGEIAVPGGFAGAGDLVRVADLSELRAEVDVSEADLSHVRLGQDAEVVPDAYADHRYRAKVVKLYPQVNRQKGTLKVEVRVENPDERLIPDMSVRVSFLAAAPAAVQGEGARPAVVVSRGAVRHAASDSYVWLARQGRAHRQTIRTGAEIGDDVVVVEGLAGGEEVIVGGEEGLSEGAAVAPQE